MARTLTLRTAKELFARLIRQAERGAILVTMRNRAPVARLAPMSSKRTLTPEQEAALERTLERASVGWALGFGKLDRESLYER